MAQGGQRGISLSLACPTIFAYCQVSQSMSEPAEVYVRADQWPEIHLNIWNDKIVKAIPNPSRGGKVRRSRRV